MTAPVTDDLETGSEALTTPEVTTEPQSLSSLLDTALDSEPSIAAEEGETPEETKARIDRGDGRDATGKFVGKEKPNDPAKPETQPAATTEQQTPAPTKAPFRYRALGKTNDVDGSEIDDAGRISFAPEQHGRLAQAFNALEVLNGQVGPIIQKRDETIATLTRERDEARSGSSAENEQAKSLVEFFGNIASEPDDEKALALMWDLRQRFPQLKANAEAAHWKAQAERANRPAAPVAPKAETEPAGPPSMPSITDARDSVMDTIEESKIDPQWKAYSADAWKHVVEKASANPFALCRPATADDAKQYSVREGQMSFDYALLRAELDGFSQRETAARETAAAQTRLAAKNAVRTQATITAPPVAGGTQPPPKSGTQRFKTKEEYEAWKASDEIDDD